MDNLDNQAVQGNQVGVGKEIVLGSQAVLGILVCLVLHPPRGEAG